jgi:hypothetical protein
MKQKINIIGLASVLILVTGTVFKINHYPGAGILLIVGITSLEFIFLPLALINHYRAEGNRQTLPLYLVTGLTAFVVFTGMLFKIQHWPFAGYLLMISLPFPYVVFLPVYLKVTSKIQNFNIFNTVYVLIMLAGLSGFSALLALTVSRERIDESLSFSMHYNKFEKILTNLPESGPSLSVTSKNAAVIKKADEVLALIDEAQRRLFKETELTEEQWKTNPAVSKILDSRSISGVLFDGDEPQLAYKLETSVKGFLDELDKTQGYSELATLAPKLLGFPEPGDRNLPWAQRLFAGNYLSWVMIDLDDFRLNVVMLKKEISSI